MKVKVGLLIALAFVMGLAFVTTAHAQSACVTMSITPDSGPAGTVVSYDGSDGFGTMNIEFDGVNIGNLDIDGGFTGTLTIPGDAQPGTHTITFLLPNEDTCPFTFTIPAAAVQQTVQQAAYPAAATVLPSTGIFLLIPAAGLLAGGSGALIMRRRKARQ